jgi:murein DD-endopeptidase MepM/ murein hydrolase activator NlpD
MAQVCQYAPTVTSSFPGRGRPGAGYVQTVTIRITTRLSPVLLVALLAGCSQISGIGATEPTGTPSASATGAVPSSTGSVAVTSSPAPAARPGYVFPVRSKAARFGRVHHDYPAADIFAPCGTEAVAVMDGVVEEVSRKDKWTARANLGATRGGLSVSIIGTDGVRYYGSHLRSIGAAIVPGHRVRAGAVLGRVGHTGSARPTACHLHFGISPPCAHGDWWNRRGVLAPYPFLSSWQDGGHRSPVKAVASWKSAHGCPTKPKTDP